MDELKILAVDTATEACSAALLVGDTLYSRWEEAPRDHTRKILPMVQALLDEAGLSLDELDAIAFGRGPGSFTGVRIGISVAQGLAFGAGVPMIGVSTLAAMAQGAHKLEGAEQVLAAIDARMDEVYWGCYAAEQGEMCLQGLEAVLAPELAQLPRGAHGDWFAAGTGWGTYGARIALQPCGSEPAMLPHAQDLLSLATFAWARGEALPADQAQPVYLRDNVATPKQPV